MDVPKPVEVEEWENIWGSKNPIHILLDLGRRFYSKYFFRLLRHNLQDGGSFLEIGSGSGTLVMKFAKAGYNAFGIDLSKQAIAVAKKEAKEKKSKAKFLLADCYDLPFEKSYFDLVWSQGVLEELEKPKECLKEQYRVLKVGGKIIASVPAKYAWLWMWRQATKNPLLGGLWPWPDHFFYEKGPLLALGKQISKNATVKSAGLLGEILFLEIRKDEKTK